VPRYLVTLKSHAEGPADEIFVDVPARSFVAAIRTAVRACKGMGPWAVMQAVPWPKHLRSADDAARKMASGAR